MARERAISPKISDLLAKSTAFLKKKGSSSPRLDAELLVGEVLGLSRIELYTNYDLPLNADEVDRYRELIRRRAEGEPVAYILGRAYFRNLLLKIDRSVLVPRPETEHVVEEALAFLMEGDGLKGAPRVLEIGTGSGAIAISLAAGFPDAEITAIDASASALLVAEENACRAGISNKIKFMKSDLFDALDPTDTFDLIVSNPPYISDEEWLELPRDIREFEPHEALYGGPDGLEFYRRLAVEAPQFLRPQGCLILEIGYRQGQAVKELLERTEIFDKVEIKQDYAGHDRVVMARRKELNLEWIGQGGSTTG
jgi:release factor glutamine methyltransferase